jgi:hypothetical protein
MRGKVAFGSAGIGHHAVIRHHLYPQTDVPPAAVRAGLWYRRSKRRRASSRSSLITSPEKRFGRVPTPITRRMMIRILETLHEVGFMLHHEDFNWRNS